MSYYNCFACKKVAPFMGEVKDECPLCGGSNGEIIGKQRVDEGMETGVYYNIDPKTGKRLKK